MIAIMIVSAIGFGLAAGFVLGHTFAVWRRHCFIQSLISDEQMHTDFVDEDADECSCRRVRVRRGVRGRGVHEIPFSGSEASVRDE